jgi:hypothetical protein
MSIMNPDWLPYANMDFDDVNKLTSTNTGVDTCAANATALGDSIATTFNGFTTLADKDWELRVQLTGRNPSGRAWVGIVPGEFAFNEAVESVANWQYCLHVSTEVQSNLTPPHPANSVYIYEGSLIPKTWVDGVWTSTDQVIRIINLGGVVCYYVDSLLIYRSLSPASADVEAVVMFGCHDMAAIAELVTGPGVGIGTGAIERGDDVGFGCEAAWQFPSPNALPLPPVAGAPIPVRFQEIAPAWNEYGHSFADQSSRHASKLSSPIRTFEIEWDGLSVAEAAILDAHYESTSSGVGFAMTSPHTQETILGCRYTSYTRGPHVRYWSQSRQARIIKYAV